jgi:hypothetical protein
MTTITLTDMRSRTARVEKTGAKEFESVENLVIEIVRMSAATCFTGSDPPLIRDTWREQSTSFFRVCIIDYFLMPINVTLTWPSLLPFITVCRRVRGQRFTAETQRTQRGRRELKAIQSSAPPLRSLRLCGEFCMLVITAIIIPFKRFKHFRSSRSSSSQKCSPLASHPRSTARAQSALMRHEITGRHFCLDRKIKEQKCRRPSPQGNQSLSLDQEKGSFPLIKLNSQARYEAC